MDNVPTEVLHQICSLLNAKDVAAFRLTDIRHSQIGCFHLVNRARFHSHTESLERLKQISDHPVFSQTVTSVVFEGNVLADMACQHSFMYHYKVNESRRTMLVLPSPNCSDREWRLYERNRLKHETDILEKYHQYCVRYQCQQKTITSKMYKRVIEKSMLSFPRLEKIELSTDGRCRHTLSQRYMEHFPVGCAMPIELNPGHTELQLQRLLLPRAYGIPSLRELRVHTLSLGFFGGAYSKRKRIGEAFKSLKVVSLKFRLSAEDETEIEEASGYLGTGVASGGLHNALQAANGLQRLVINFEADHYQGPCLSIRHVLADTVWPELRWLDLSCMLASKGHFLSAAKRQPSLKDFFVADIWLEEDLWPDVVDSMRHSLKLTTFMARGCLHDQGELYDMERVDRDAYSEFPTVATLSCNLDSYVCNCSQYPNETNPLLDDVFVDRDDLPPEVRMSGADEDDLFSLGSCESY